MSDRTEGAGGDGGGGSAGGGGGIAHLPPQEDQQSLIESFRGITSSTPAEALFFLESHAWQLDAALQSFFDAADDDDYDTARSLPPAVAAAASQPAAPSGRPRRRRRQLQEEEEEGEDDEDYVPLAADESPRQRPATRLTAAAMASSSGSGKSSKPTGGSSGRPAGGIRTLADLNRRSGRGSGSDSDEESDGPQEYYTGGEKSGMLVQDPSKGNTDVDAIFEQARQMGTTHESIDHLRSSSSKSFTGTGRLLTGETVEAAPEPPESVIHEVVFWTNGFTVNDGPLRRFDDPENAAFLESIKRSECPMELAPADRRTAVHVSLSRRDQKCPEPAKRFNPFGGVGRTLGAGSSTSSASPEAASAPASAAPAGSSSSAAGLHVDDSLPSTSIQLRLADGTRMVARFNNHHTVGDIRGFIDASRPGATRSYLLQTVGFPPKQLTDATQTIEQAGLANSVVIQKL